MSICLAFNCKESLYLPSLPYVILASKSIFGLYFVKLIAIIAIVMLFEMRSGKNSLENKAGLSINSI